MTEELQQLQQQLTLARETTFTVTDDRQALTLEVQQLRTHMAHLVHENETLKQKADRVMANGHPEIFENTQGVNEMIANWMEMDMRDGDELLVALGHVHPHSLKEIEAMLGESAEIRQQESSLEEYYRYFEKRFKMFQTIWARVVGIHFHMDEAFKRFKDSAAANLLGMEPVLGKKSAAMDELREDFRRLMNLEYGEFMDEQWRIQNKIIQLKYDHCARKIEEKEQEKQRFFAKCDAENKAVKAKSQLDVEEKQKEIDSTKEEMRKQAEIAAHNLHLAKLSHSDQTQFLKQVLKDRNSNFKHEISATLQEFANYQNEIKEQLRLFCLQKEKEIEDLKRKHAKEKLLMRNLMVKRNNEFRTEFKQISTDFQTFQKEIEAQIATFCDFYREEKLDKYRQYEYRLNLVLEDARCETKRRDEKFAKEKRYISKLLAILRKEFNEKRHNFEENLKEIKTNLRKFCENTTHSSNFEFDQTVTQYENRLKMIQEDFWSEILKRDKEKSDLISHFTRQKSLMREIMRKTQTELREKYSNLSVNFVEEWRKMVISVSVTLRKSHDQYTFALKSENEAQVRMVKEEFLQEIVKKEAEMRDFKREAKEEMELFRERFGNVQKGLKEDARSYVMRVDVNTDALNRKRASELETCLFSYLSAMETAYFSHIQSSNTAISALEPYGLPVPTVEMSGSNLPEPSDNSLTMEAGLQLYNKAIARVPVCLEQNLKSTDFLLSHFTQREEWLVKEWIQLETRRQTLQTQLQAAIVEHDQLVEELRQEKLLMGHSHEKAASELTETIANLETQLNDTKENFASLNSQFESKKQDLAAKIASIEELQATLFSKNEEIVGYQAKVEELEKMAATHVEGAQQIIDQLQEQIQENERKYEISRHMKAYRRLIMNFRHRMKGIKRSYLLHWRVKSVPQVIQEKEEPAPLIMDDDDSEDETELDLVEEFIQEEKRLALENNVMVENFNKAGGKPERPLTIPQALKFFEDMMDKKYDADVGDIKNGRPLRTLPDFFLEFLSRTFGLKKLAIKMLCQIIPTLEIMNNEGTPYCQLFCRLVQVTHPDPVPFPLAVFLTRVRFQFGPLAEKYQRDKEARDSKKGVKKEVGKGKGKDLGATGGGEAYLLDVIGFISSTFENDKRSSELMLKLLKPPGISTVDYVVFRMCHKISKMGMTVDNVYSTLDIDGDGMINESEFVKASRRSLELYVSTDELSQCFRMITSGAKEMTKEMFLSKINFKSYIENCKNDLYTVNRVNFLLSLIEVYHNRQKRDGAQVKNLLGSRNVIGQDAFEAFLRRIEPRSSLGKQLLCITNV